MAEPTDASTKLLIIAWVLLAAVSLGICWVAVENNDAGTLSYLIFPGLVAAGAYNRLYQP